MSLFDTEPLPGFEKGWNDAKARREAEERAIAEVLPFEREKQAVNQQVVENAMILGVADVASHPIELSDKGRKA